VALGRALQTFAQIELEAGRDLVGFAAEYVSFQLRFLTTLAAMPLAAVDAFAPSMLAGVTPGSQAAVTPANITPTGLSGNSQATSSPVHTVTLRPKTLRSVVPESESATKTTPKAQGETNGQSRVTHKQATDTGSTTSSTTGSAGQTDAGSQHQPHHGDGQPKGSGNKG
jgi:hypothetical protein